MAEPDPLKVEHVKGRYLLGGAAITGTFLTIAACIGLYKFNAGPPAAVAPQPNPVGDSSEDVKPDILKFPLEIVAFETFTDKVNTKTVSIDRKVDEERSRVRFALENKTSKPVAASVEFYVRASFAEEIKERTLSRIAFSFIPKPKPIYLPDNVREGDVILVDEARTFSSIAMEVPREYRFRAPPSNGNRILTVFGNFVITLADGRKTKSPQVAICIHPDSPEDPDDMAPAPPN